jgi:hypothetical protein
MSVAAQFTYFILDDFSVLWRLSFFVKQQEDFLIPLFRTALPHL